MSPKAYVSELIVWSDCDFEWKAVFGQVDQFRGGLFAVRLLGWHKSELMRIHSANNPLGGGGMEVNAGGNKGFLWFDNLNDLIGGEVTIFVFENVDPFVLGSCHE